MWDLALWAVIGGLLNRIRGGLFDHIPEIDRWIPHQVGRILLSLAWGLMIAGLDWHALSFSLLFFLGILNGWGTFMDMGRSTTPSDDDPPVYLLVGREDQSLPFWRRWIRDAFGKALRGVLMVLGTGGLGAYLGILPGYYLLIGMALPVFYELEQQLAARGWHEDASWFRRAVVHQETLAGAYLFGMTYWMLLI